MVRPYELMCILTPNIEPEQVETLTQRWSNLVTEGKGTVTKVEPWGKRRLAYEIAKNKEGFYWLMQFEAETEVAKELERVVKLTDSVLRQLLIRRGE